MKTQRLAVDPNNLETPQARKALAAAAGILRAGGLVAIPTETVYGLAANALDPDAVARIFAAKQRPSWDPVIVHITVANAGPSMLHELVAEVPEAARKLMDAFWPGPLTLLLPRSRAVPDSVTAGRALVGVRMPAHPVALALIQAAGLPLAAPSANLFGHTSPTTADHVLDDLNRRIDAVLDAGPTRHGVESTVLDPCQSPMIIYRPGTITAQQIRETAGAVEIFDPGPLLTEAPQQALPSPGVGLRHYAPRARLVLVDAGPPELASRLAKETRLYPGDRVGVLMPSNLPGNAPEDLFTDLSALIIEPWGSWSAPEEMAKELYSGLRALDAQGCTVILCPLPPAEGIGAAIRDRLRKAARA